MTTAEPVRIGIPSLFGGVSKQPPHVRFANQCEDADNVDFYVDEGADKRDGSWFIRQVCDPSLPDDPRLHVIDRDGSEQYLVTYGKSDIRVFEVGGPEAIVTISTDAQAYIDAGGADADQLRLRTIADYTVILNTTVKVSTESSAVFEVTAEWRDYDLMRSHTPVDGEYHKAIRDGSFGDAGHHLYDVKGTTFSTLTLAELTGEEAASVNGHWNNSNGAPFGFAIKFKRNALTVTAGAWTTATKTLVQVGKFVDAVGGDYINVTGGTNVVTGWYLIDTVTDDDTVVLNAEITSGSTDETDVTADGLATHHEAQMSPSANPQPGGTRRDMYEVAFMIQLAMETAGAEGALCEWVLSPGTQIGGKAGHFRITSPYRGDDTTVIDVESPSSGTDMTQEIGSPQGVATPIPVGGTVVAGTGTGSKTLAVEDRWTPVQQSGEGTSNPDPLTMPLQMVRTAVSDNEEPARFSIDLIDWKKRASGTDLTNPIPSLWKHGVAIQDIAFLKNRLVLMGDEFVVMSQSGDLFNYFLDDADNIVASDPIDVQLSETEVTLIDYGVAQRGTLVIFTKSGDQFEVGSPDSLTQDTVAVVATTNYQAHSIRPQAIGQYLLFLGKLDCDAQLLEYAFDESKGSPSAEDASAHVRDYLPNDLRSLAVHPNERVAIILPDDANTLYLYRSFIASGNKHQSAWTKHTYDSGYTIDDIGVIGQHCYMLIETTAGHHFERFTIPREDKACPVPTVVLCEGVHTNSSQTTGTPGGSSGASGTPSGGCPATVQVGTKTFATDSTAQVTLVGKEYCTDISLFPCQTYWQGDYASLKTCTYLSSTPDVVITWTLDLSGFTLTVSYHVTNGWVLDCPANFVPDVPDAHSSGTISCIPVPFDKDVAGIAAQQHNRTASTQYEAFDNNNRTPTPSEWCDGSNLSSGGACVVECTLDLFPAVRVVVSSDCGGDEGFFVPFTVCEACP